MKRFDPWPKSVLAVSTSPGMLAVWLISVSICYLWEVKNIRMRMSLPHFARNTLARIMHTLIIMWPFIPLIFRPIRKRSQKFTFSVQNSSFRDWKLFFAFKIAKTFRVIGFKANRWEKLKFNFIQKYDVVFFWYF